MKLTPSTSTTAIILITLVILIFAAAQTDAQDRNYRLKSHTDYAERLATQEQYDRALEKFHSVLDQITIEGDTELYGRVMFGIATCHVSMSEIGNKLDHLLIAIDAFEKSIDIKAQYDDPWDYIDLLDQMANAYVSLSDLESYEDHLNSAIEINQKLVSVCRENDLPYIDAVGLIKVSSIYLCLAEIRDTEKYVNISLGLLNPAIDSLTDIVAEYDEFKAYYHVFEILRGINYMIISEVREREKNLGLALYSFEHPLKNITPDDSIAYPLLQYAMSAYYQAYSQVRDTAQYLEKAMKYAIRSKYFAVASGDQDDIANNARDIADIYLSFANIRDTIDNLDSAIMYLKQAEKYFTKEISRIDYASIQTNFAELYYMRSLVENRKENVELGFEFIDQALETFNESELPLHYGATQALIGMLYSSLSRAEDRELNMKKAMDAFDISLKIFTQENYPLVYDEILGFIEKAKK